MPEETADPRERAAQLLGRHLARADRLTGTNDPKRLAEWEEQKTREALEIVDLIILAARVETREA